MSLTNKPSFTDTSHKLRTHLTIIIGEAELALRKEREGHLYKEPLETILKEANAMQSFIEHLLLFFKDR